MISIFLFSLFVLVKPQLLTNSTSSTVETDIAEEEWKEFKLIHNKTYNSPEEDEKRFKYYQNNRKKIAKNKFINNGRWDFKKQLNDYSVMLDENFEFPTLNFNEEQELLISSGFIFVSISGMMYPEEVDWRKHGAVTSVKFEKVCIASWAFSAIGAIEGQYFRKTGKLLELSAQNLVDCSKPYGNNGCGGGEPTMAYEYIKNNDGINTEVVYPFEGKEGHCRYKASKDKVTIKDFAYIEEGDEKALEAAVATIGPISVVLSVPEFPFSIYESGIFYLGEHSRNNSEDVTVFLLVVGYGKEANGERYWILKNSWSPRWGIKGYIKLAKDRNNHCDVATHASYPIL